MEMKSCDRCGKEITPVTYRITGGMCRPCETGANCTTCGEFVMYPSMEGGKPYCQPCGRKIYQQELAARKAKKKRQAKPGPPPKSLAESWQRIQQWHQKEAPETFTLGAGADPSEVDALEQEIGHSLPDDLRASLLLHNGIGGGWLLHFGELLTVRQITDSWRRYSQWQQTDGFGLGDGDVNATPPGHVRPIFWDPTRIPLTDNSGNHVFCDLSPDQDGHHGQIVKHCHEVGPTEVLAKSWSDWLAMLVTDLESGIYEFDEDEETVAPLGHYE